MKKILLFITVLCALAFSASAAEFADMPDNWSTAALQAAVDNGLMSGSDGYILPDKQLTRAEMATIIVRAFGATALGDISSFNDMDEEKWYYNEMAKAYAMGVFKGDAEGKMNPENSITRQEAFVVLARAFSISTDNIEAVNKFSDAGDVSEWALKEVAGLVESGYISGSNGYIKPLDNITRAEFAQLMYNLVKAYVTGIKTVSGTFDGNVIIKEAVTLRDVTINGDVVISDGVSGSVTFDNVTVNGRLILRSGNGTKLDGTYKNVVVTGENIKVTASSDTKIESQTVTGTGSEITVEKENTSSSGTTVVTPSNPSGGTHKPGNDNTGDDNTGDDNTGDDNTGDDNTGDDNTGDDNTGDDNTGDDNTGDDNTGDDNTGDDNTGDDNTGDDNTGDDNTDDEDNEIPDNIVVKDDDGLWTGWY